MARAKRTINSPGGQRARQETSLGLEDSKGQGVLGQRGLTKSVLRAFINVKTDIGINQWLDKGHLLLTLKHRPSDLCRCDADAHPYPEHRSGPVGRTLRIGPWSQEDLG